MDRASSGAIEVADIGTDATAGRDKFGDTQAQNVRGKLTKISNLAGNNHIRDSEIGGDVSLPAEDRGFGYPPLFEEERTFDSAGLSRYTLLYLRSEQHRA